MSNLTIHFSNPWLLLLLIPAFALALIPYFRLSKKYRRTRNRIISVITHLCAMVLCICVLCGIQFRYVKKNTDNEILLLVDVSDTEQRAEKRRDDFVQTVLSDGKYDGYKIGVVTFGFTQNYAVPLTYKIDEIYDLYKAAELPDTSATNIEGALKCAKELFSHPESSKVVLITDGRETDGNAFSALNALTAQGTVVDVAYISEDFQGNSDVQTMEIQLPETHVKPNENCTIKVKLRSRTATTNTRVILKDNGEAIKVEDSNGNKTNEKNVNLAVGENELAFTHKFASSGLHKITVEVFDEADSFAANNGYTSYFYLQNFNKVLIVERKEAESDALIKILDEQEYSVDRLNLTESNELKTHNNVSIQSVTDLRNYDQLIMNNVSNGDLAKFEGLTEMIYSYVNDFGGGLLTLGGDDETGAAHAYSRSDLKGTKYQELLPVEAIDYTPPVGLVVCVDRSGSMNGKFEDAKQGLISCYNALNERDYMGIVSLDTNYGVILPLTSRTHTEEITRQIHSNPSLQTPGGNTDFFKAIQRAGEMLQSNKQVEKKHIIIVTDGYPNPAESLNYSVAEAIALAQRDISISVVLVQTPSSEVNMNMHSITDPSKGTVTWESGDNLINLMREALRAKQTEETVNEPFAPIVKSPTSSIFSGVEYGINQDSGSGGSSGSSGSGDGKDGEEEKDERDAFRMRVKLGGFYGVKKKDGATLLLTGDYDVAPLYVQWKFGNGTVGSFMCDLSGLKKADGQESWSAAFMNDENGKKLILNIIDNLMPVEDISPAAIEYRLTESNYTNSLRVFANLDDGEYIDARIELGNGETVSLNEASGDGDVYVITPFSKENLFSKCEFIVKRAGVYKVVITKRTEKGEEIIGKKVEIFKTFSFSEEYNLYPHEEDQESVLVRIAGNGRGKKIEDLTDPKEIFESFVTGIEKTFDPRYLFAILSILLLLTDIAVRKFKFKWLHEIIGEKKQKKEAKRQAA